MALSYYSAQLRCRESRGVRRPTRMPDNELHVIPVADLIEHDDDDCVCGPEVTPIEREDGSIGWRVTHHALDGRE